MAAASCYDQRCPCSTVGPEAEVDSEQQVDRFAGIQSTDVQKERSAISLFGEGDGADSGCTGDDDGFAVKPEMLQNLLSRKFRIRHEEMSAVYVVLSVPAVIALIPFRCKVSGDEERQDIVQCGYGRNYL